nr:MAG TPA: hypothetical protein [Caudoviricetes sp.]DAX23831.1 MAG TPA: hypothetical protein [Caudoviricetes sp.]
MEDKFISPFLFKKFIIIYNPNNSFFFLLNSS